MYNNENIFARILRGELPCKKVYEDEQVLAFEDIMPAAPVHVLVIPKASYCSLHDFAANAHPEAIGQFFQKVHYIAKQLGVEEAGYRIITNHGADASQTVPHFHVHILGGKKLGALLPGGREE